MNTNKRVSEKSEFQNELETELAELKKTMNIISRNPVFINEEVAAISSEIKKLESILSVLK